ncbi:MAG TPA: signal peptidase I [Bdellovibrionota bacterium]|jgi:signal peptidase I|nr:signal peptidase I [Bdellovibrionota bacterium]
MNRTAENILSLALALLLVFMVRSSVVEAFKIPSGSMIPTLLVGDHIFVNKFAYGIKVPFSDFFTDRPIYFHERPGPRRGDIIVFKYPRSADETIYYIKRVIGLPGDTIEVREKKLIINGETMERIPATEAEAKTVLESIKGTQYDRPTLEIFKEKLGEHDPYVLLDRANFIAANYGPTQVPSGNYFVMGDNRDYSNDSRFWGFVPSAFIQGKAMVVWLSIKFGILSDGESSFHPERIATLLN